MSVTYFSIIGLIVSGMVSAGIFAVLTRLSTLNTMNLVEYLSTLFTPRAHPRLGWALHFMPGCMFALLYVGLWSLGLRTSDFYLYGLLGGIVQWLIVGILMAGAPAVHAGICAGTLPARGLYMRNVMVWACGVSRRALRAMSYLVLASSTSISFLPIIDNEELVAVPLEAKR